jgi:hypothetical protein
MNNSQVVPGAILVAPAKSAGKPGRKSALHTIRLTSDGTVHEGLTIEEAHGGSRDRMKGQLPLGRLVEEGGVEFKNKAGKTWFLRFSEFQFFVVPARKRVPEKLALAA